MRVLETFWAFLKLGCIAFGGPTAHIAYFEDAFVRKRSWITLDELTELVALCQFLPGPGSSQVGFAIGLKRAGIPGAFAAWLGFTAPATILMIGFALGLQSLEVVSGEGWLRGLLVVAVAVVANAVWNMAQRFCDSRLTAFLAAISALILVLWGMPGLPLVLIVGGALVGVLTVGKVGPLENLGASNEVSAKHSGAPYLLIFFAGLLGLPIIAEIASSELLSKSDAFYRAGSLVFGGGHVVLPLLHGMTVGSGWVGEDVFLAGYGAAQAIPGPLFAFTAFLGASIDVGWSGVLGGVFALVVTYIPAWLLVLGVIPIWARIRGNPRARQALTGVNAVVVGILFAALYDPVFVHGVGSFAHLLMAIVCLFILRKTRVPSYVLVMASALVGQIVF